VSIYFVLQPKGWTASLHVHTMQYNIKQYKSHVKCQIKMQLTLPMLDNKNKN